MRKIEIGDEVLVRMKVVGFEPQGRGRKTAIMVKLPSSPHKFDHRLTRDQLLLAANLTWY